MWLHNGKPVLEPPEGALGFIYIITNKVTGRKYVGKKTFLFRKTKQVKGKKKRSLVESDWQNYYGSNKELIADVEALGAEQFTREIIHFCFSKGEMNYLETREILVRDCLLTDDYYNQWCTVKVSSSHVKKLWKSEKKC